MSTNLYESRLDYVLLADVRQSSCCATLDNLCVHAIEDALRTICAPHDEVDPKQPLHT
eukprot:CAMPEP_0202908916 /NCGR_PEP_ID=MMETSP1392-20130828/47598_1 /ASSEMBLY_ACC=CAM_ASM_000868 /TAXON_ID=225041 /ORGANISM="Chlamydomonas chlamydogama, Strain SAG 11-48b" /LENGTH=57 /DNA_ID=CAMNT_0049598457 /DNA_START=75 /DNA_END=248 /DNA_ORIENTATION=+